MLLQDLHDLKVLPQQLVNEVRVLQSMRRASAGMGISCEMTAQGH